MEFYRLVIKNSKRSLTNQDIEMFIRGEIAKFMLQHPRRLSSVIGLWYIDPEVTIQIIFNNLGYKVTKVILKSDI